ncbi:MAG: PhnD/SsuA/transferrin family substrate-binding protein, partial [Magnetococcus sp. WYHC-3]
MPCRACRRSLFWLLTPLLLLICFGTARADEPRDVRLGIQIDTHEDQTVSRWTPLAQQLTALLPAYRFRIIPMREGEPALLVANGLVDLALVNAPTLAVLEERLGARRLISRRSLSASGAALDGIGGVIVVRNEDPGLLALRQLAGRRLAAVRRSSLGGWILPLHLLRKNGLEVADFEHVLFMGSHEEAINALLAGQVDAALVRTGTLESLELQAGLSLHRLRVLAPRHDPSFPLVTSTPLLPEWILAQAPRGNPRLGEQVALALLNLPPDHPANQAAGVAGWTLAQNQTPMHTVLKELALPPYEGWRSQIRRQLWERSGLWGILAALVLLFSIITLYYAHRLRALRAELHRVIQSEFRYRTTFEQAGVGVLHATATGTLLEVNAALCQMSGQGARELLGQNLIDLSDSRELARELSLYEELRSGILSQLRLEKPLRRPDDSSLWVQMTLTALRDAEGHITHLVGLVDDISRRMRLEQELAQTNRRLSLILECSGDGILGLDTMGRHTFVNAAAARMLGWKIPEMLGMNSHAMWHHSRADGRDFPVEDCPIVAVLSEGRAYRNREEWIWRKDGSVFAAVALATPLVEGGKILGAVVLFRPLAVP